MITNEVVNKAITYILEHISEKITIEDVANHCYFSKFHFSRIFKAETGISVYSFINNIKLHQSAFRLKIEPTRKITDIGFDYGYTPSNYSSFFKLYYNISPATFRKTIFNISINHNFFHLPPDSLDSFEQCNSKITIKTIPDIPVIYERFIGNYHNLKTDWANFNNKYISYITPNSQFIELTYDDPSITDVNHCLYDICVSIDNNIDVNNLPNVTTIEGGKFAVYHYEGLTCNIYAAYQSLFISWFPNTNYEIDNRYSFDIYSSVDCENLFVIMDIYLPIKQ